MTGPVFSLRIFGLICPCFEKEEDRAARISMESIHKKCTAIDWHLGHNKPSAAKAAGFVRGLFGNRQQQHTDKEPPTRAQIRIVDATKDSINNGAPYPELQIKPLPKNFDEEDGDNEQQEQSPRSGGLKGMLQRQSQAFQVDIPLHHIIRVDTIDPTMLVIVTKDIHSTDEKKSIKEAARISFTSADDRDAVCHDINVLAEWQRNRQPDIDEDLPAEGIKSRAMKAAHFAKRELEMRETKRSREQRKAKYIQDAGGLKYTAMAAARGSGG